ncbi:MAG TPA: hydroxyacid dehydrogenase [Burkholderiales bacterium]|nr:hydroxyacid dehydrogenase [Burkholderiales bacterium]
MRARKKVLMVQGLHPEGVKLLAARADVEPLELMTDDEAQIMAAARDADAITVRSARITRRVIEAARKLKIVARHGVGYDAVDVGALSARGVPLAISIHANMVPVAEHVMFMLLALFKEAAHYDALARGADWGSRWNVRANDLAGKNLLIVGFGRTGSRVARRALAFDMKVHACDPYIDQALIRQAGCAPVADLRAALPGMDAVSVNCPLSAETRHMFSRAELGAMKPGAVIVNCARGGIVDEAALYEALVAGRLRGAGLDVFEREPSPADNPLFRLKNVIVSPHVAGVTVESTIRMSAQTAQNVLDCFDGKLDRAVVVNQEVLQPKIAL